MTIKNIAIACQGGGSHAAYSAGVLQGLLPLLDEKDEELRLVGISGTSGGAICALLAWYGWLTAGPAIAARKLENFWHSNCAMLPGEKLWNESTITMLETMSFDIKFSPYDPPLRETEEAITRLWPSVAKLMGNYNPWMRGDYFLLDELVQPHVDFDLIAALGDFCSIPFDIKRWLTADFQLGALDGAGADREKFESIKAHLERKILHGLNMPAKLRKLMDDMRIRDDAPLSKAFGKWDDRTCVFESRQLVDLSNAVLKVTNDIPQLLLGAVDIGDGAFFAFSSERSQREGGISIKSVLASAALPWLFQAVAIEMDGADGKAIAPHKFWDGLFSQNPPIKNFISGLIDDTKKPDEFWVVQINPDEFALGSRRRERTSAVDALSGNEIWHTRDALSGNLSLNQEVSFLESVNKILDGERVSGYENHKHVQVHRIVMDGGAVEAALGRRLGVFSKLDRDPELKDKLVAHGRQQAMRFVSVRRVLAQAGSDLTSLPSAKSDGGHEADGTVRALKSLRSEDGKGNAPLIVDGTTLHHQHESWDGKHPQVCVRWHAKGKNARGEKIGVDGDATLGAVDGIPATWRLNSIAIANMERIEPARTAGAASKLYAAGKA
jgi:predicted acylesterase/phospholipase RssA